MKLLPAIILLSFGCRPAPIAKVPGRSPIEQHAGLRVLCIDLDTMEKSEASGFFVADGQLVTCNHVLKGLPLGVLLPDGRKLTIEKVIDHDPDADLALVRVDGSLPALAQSKVSPAKGARLRVISRFGLTEGVAKGPYDDPEVGEAFLLSAPGLRVGASGGAVVDDFGSVVGVVRGAVDDDADEVVVVPARRIRQMNR